MHLLAAHVLLLLATAGQSFVLPTPTGPHKIGTSHFASMMDTTSFRVPTVMPVQLWYPVVGGSKLAPYVDPTVMAALEKSGYYQQSPETILAWSSVVTHSLVDANVAKGKHPLLILLPGAGVCGFQYTALAEEFASRGYVVAVVDYYAPSLPDTK